MPRAFKCDTEQFNGIRSTLEIVDIYLRAEKLKSAILSAEQQIDLEEKNVSSQIPAIREDIFDVIDGLASTQTTEQRKAALSNILELVAAKRKAGRNDLHIRQLLEQVAMLYLRWDTELLREEIEELGATGITENKLPKIRAKKTALEVKLLNLWEDCEKSAFNRPGQVPIRYMTMHATRQTAMEACVYDFIRTWRTRAALFGRPVTVMGVGIHTLPEPLRSYWAKAYKALNLSPAMAPMYQFKTYTGTSSLGRGGS